MPAILMALENMRMGVLYLGAFLIEIRVEELHEMVMSMLMFVDSIWRLPILMSILATAQVQVGMSSVAIVASVQGVIRGHQGRIDPGLRMVAWVVGHPLDHTVILGSTSWNSKI